MREQSAATITHPGARAPGILAVGYLLPAHRPGHTPSDQAICNWCRKYPRARTSQVGLFLACNIPTLAGKSPRAHWLLAGEPWMPDPKGLALKSCGPKPEQKHLYLRAPSTKQSPLHTSRSVVPASIWIRCCHVIGPKYWCARRR
jgi:hypothetical protein